MTREEYNVEIEKQIEICRGMLISKGREYATNDDPFHNFNVAAPLYSGNPKTVLGGYLMKHVVSIYDMLQSDESFSIDKWTEKITDNINYLLILKAMVVNDVMDKNITDKDIESPEPQQCPDMTTELNSVGMGVKRADII